MRPPSVLVSELLDAIEQGFETPGRDIGDAIVTQHRLQAFSPGYFRGERLFSYSAENAAAALSAVAGRREKPPFISSNLPEPQPAWRSIDVQALVRFYANPARWLLNRRLGIRLEEAGAFLDDVEPMSLEGLESYELGELLAARCLEGLEARDLLPAARALGSLPPGTPGDCGFQEICEGVEAFAARLRPHLKGEPLGAVDLDCALGPFRLTGRLQLGLPSALVHYRYASIKAKDLLRSWIHHLALSAGGSGRYPGRCVIIGQDRGYVLGPVADAESILLGLLEIYWQRAHEAPALLSRYRAGLHGDPSQGKDRRGSPESRGQDVVVGLRILPRGMTPTTGCVLTRQDPLDASSWSLPTAILKPLLERAGEEG